MQVVVFLHELLFQVISFIRDLRADNDVEKKPSVRASIGLYERAQSNALISGRKKVSLKDIQDVIVSVLSHRINLKPSIKFLKSPEDYIREEFEKFMEGRKVRDVAIRLAMSEADLYRKQRVAT